MTITVKDVHAVEILDSRARPTLAVTLTSAEGVVVRAGVPSGASTGSREAVELRDGDKSRFGGQGVLGAVASVNGEIAASAAGPELRGPRRAGRGADRPGRDREQVASRRQRHRRRVDGGGQGHFCSSAAYRSGAPSPAPGWPRGCRCRTSTWSTAGYTRRTSWTSRSSCWPP